jgi:antitoxin HigA-1
LAAPWASRSTLRHFVLIEGPGLEPDEQVPETFRQNRQGGEQRKIDRRPHREEFLVPLKTSAGALAKACGLPRTRVERIASEQTGITADTALRLAKALGTTAQLWLNLQNDYDVQIAKRNLGKILDRIETINRPKAA